MRVPTGAALGLVLLTVLGGCGGDDASMSDEDVAAIRGAEQALADAASVRVETQVGAVDGGSYTPSGCVTQIVAAGPPAEDGISARVERRDGACGIAERTTVLVVDDRVWASQSDGRWRAGRLGRGVASSLSPRRSGFADLVAAGTVVNERREGDERSWTVEVPADRLRSVGEGLGATFPGGESDVDARIDLRLDAAGRLGWVQLSARAAGQGVRTATTYRDYDAVRPILAPDAADVDGDDAQIDSEAQLREFAETAGVTSGPPRLGP